MSMEQLPPSQPPDLPQDKHVLPRLLEERAEADYLWNEGKPIVRHGREEQPLIAHLQDSGIPLTQWSRVFDGDGKVRILEKPEFNYDEVTPKFLSNIVTRRLWPVIRLINPAIDQAYEKGFTGHGGVDHIIPVTKNTWEFLKRAGGTAKEQKIGICAALGHDAGLHDDRALHHLISSRWLMALMPEIRNNEAVAREIRKTIILHDEKVASQYMDILAMKHGVDTEAFYEALLKKFGRPALALIIADKADALNRRRATRKRGVAGEELIQDPQTLITVLGDSRGYETINIPGTEGKQKHIRTLSFLPYLDEGGLEAYNVEPGKHGHEVRVPSLYRTLHREQGVPHFFSWMADNWTFNTKRLGLEARALFALFPDLNTYELKIVDDSAKDSGFIMSFIYSVDHAGVKDFLRYLSEKMSFPNKSNRTPEKLPVVFRNEANFMRKQNVESLMEVDSLIKNVLWKSEDGESSIVAEYQFLHPHMPEAVDQYVARLFSPKSQKTIFNY